MFSEFRQDSYLPYIFFTYNYLDVRVDISNVNQHAKCPMVPYNTYRRELFYDDNFTQYSTAIKSTIHHQSNLCYLDSRFINCILISSII